MSEKSKKKLLTPTAFLERFQKWNVFWLCSFNVV